MRPLFLHMPSQARVEKIKAPPPPRPSGFLTAIRSDPQRQTKANDGRHISPTAESASLPMPPAAQPNLRTFHTAGAVSQVLLLPLPEALMIVRSAGGGGGGGGGRRKQSVPLAPFDKFMRASSGKVCLLIKGSTLGKAAVSLVLHDMP